MKLRTFLAVAFAFLVAALAAAADGWHPSLEKGIAAAKKSGRAVFVVTLWPPGV